ncbi:MAG: hypothetical protein ACOC0Z_06715 [Halohasta sp.]
MEPSRHGLIALCSCVAFLLVHVGFDGQLWIAGVVFTPSSGLAVPLGMGFGMPAAVGLAAGAVAKDLLRMTLSAETALSALSLFVAAAFAAVCWRGWPSPAAVDGRRLDRWLAVAGLVVSASALGAATFAWGSELVGIHPFYLAFGATFVSFLGSALAWLVVAALLVTRGWLPERVARIVARPTARVPSVRPRRLLTVLPVVWAVAGLLWSVGFRIRERAPLDGFERLGLEALYYGIHPDLFGRGGRRAQVVFGALMGSLLVVVLRRSTDGASN